MARTHLRSKPFPEKAISLIREFLDNAPTDDSNFFTQAFGTWAQTHEPRSARRFGPYVNGAYVNVPNVGMDSWETAYWGSKFDRLREIEAKYDPHNVFQYEQSIPPAFPC